MGATVNKSVVDIIDESVVEVVTEYSSSANTSGSNQILLSGLINKSNLNIDQLSKINLSVLNNFQLDMDMVTQIMDKIKQKAEAEGTLFGVVVSDQTQKIERIFRDNITQKYNFECNTSQQNMIKIASDFIANESDINITQGSFILKQCSNKATSTIKSLKDVAQEIDQDVKSSLEFIKMGAGFIAFVFIIIVGILIYVSMRGSNITKVKKNYNKSSNNQDTNKKIPVGGGYNKLPKAIWSF